MSTAVVRAATLDDAAQLADIYNHYVANTVITFEEQAVSTGEMSSRMADVQGHGLPWLVAEQEGAIVGYSYASKWKARSAYRH